MPQPRDSTTVETWFQDQPITEKPLDLSVVIPAYNEERRLPSTLIDAVDFLDSRGIAYELIVVDDGSSDGTVEIVKKFQKIRTQVKLLCLPRNYGKGHAVRTGMLNARGNLLLFTDADGATPITELARLEDGIKSGADVAIGSRAISSTETEVVTKWYLKFRGRVFNRLVNLLLLPHYADTQCGFKLFTARSGKFLFRHQQSDGFGFDIELLYLAERIALKVVELPVNWHRMPGSKVHPILDPIRMLIDVFVFRFRHRAFSRASYDSYLAGIGSPKS